MKPSPFGTIPRGPRWYAQVAEYQKGPPTLGEQPAPDEPVTEYPEPRISKGEQP